MNSFLAYIELERVQFLNINIISLSMIINYIMTDRHVRPSHNDSKLKKKTEKT